MDVAALGARLNKTFLVKGFSPVSGRLAVVTVSSTSAETARREAEASGLRFVTVVHRALVPRLYIPDPPPK